MVEHSSDWQQKISWIQKSSFFFLKGPNTQDLTQHSLYRIHGLKFVKVMDEVIVYSMDITESEWPAI